MLPCSLVTPPRPYSTPTRQWWRCLLWCTTYEPCQLDTRPSYARGPSLFPSAVTQTIRPAGSPSAMDAPCATSFIWGELAVTSSVVQTEAGIYPAAVTSLLPHSSSLCFVSFSPIPTRFQSSKSGKIYLHRDIRLLFSRKSMEVDSGAAYELQSFTESPIDPPFSPRCWGPTPLPPPPGRSLPKLQSQPRCQRQTLTQPTAGWKGSKREVSTRITWPVPKILSFIPSVTQNWQGVGELRAWETRQQWNLVATTLDQRGWVKGYGYKVCFRSCSPG